MPERLLAHPSGTRCSRSGPQVHRKRDIHAWLNFLILTCSRANGKLVLRSGYRAWIDGCEGCCNTEVFLRRICVGLGSWNRCLIRAATQGLRIAGTESNVLVLCCERVW